MQEAIVNQNFPQSETVSIQPTFFHKFYKQTWLVIIISVLALAFLWPKLFSSSVQDSVSVVGVGKTVVQADRAKIIFTFSIFNNDRAQAFRNGEQKATEIKKALSAFSFSSVKITTAQVTPQSGGYQYSNGGQIVIDDLSQIDDLVNVLLANNASPAQISYSIKDESAISDILRTQALVNAQEKADQLVKVAGGRRGHIINLTEQPINFEIPATITKDITDTSIKNIEISANITTTFSLQKRWILF